MKKLNNKGMTSVEILVSFVLVVIIATSMYTSVVSYKNKQQVESYKQRVLTYKNLLTKEIQDDLITKKLTGVVKSYPDPDSTLIIFTFADGSTKELTITTPYDNESEKSFRIKYGDGDYPLPDFGSYCKDSAGDEVDCDDEHTYEIKNLRIQNVDVNTDDNILTVKFDFYHPDLSIRYGVDIVCPINYNI